MDFLLLAEFNAENLKTLKTSVEVIEVFDILEGCFYKVDVVNWVNMVYIGCLKYNKINCGEGNQPPLFISRTLSRGSHSGKQRRENSLEQRGGGKAAER